MALLLSVILLSFVFVWIVYGILIHFTGSGGSGNNTATSVMFVLSTLGFFGVLLYETSSIQIFCDANKGWNRRKIKKAPRLTYTYLLILASTFVLRNLFLFAAIKMDIDNDTLSYSWIRVHRHIIDKSPEFDSYPQIGVMPDPYGTISKSIRDSWGSSCGGHCVSTCAPVAEEFHTSLRAVLKEWLRITAHLNITTINIYGSLIASLYRNTTLMRWDTDVDMLVWAHDVAALEKFASVYNTEASNTGFELVVQPDWRNKYIDDSSRKRYPERGVNFVAPCARLYADRGFVDVYCMYPDEHDAEDGGPVVAADNFMDVQIFENLYNWRSIPREWMFPLQPCYLDGILMDCPARGSQVLREVYGDISTPDHFLDQTTGCWEKGTKKAFDDARKCKPIQLAAQCTGQAIDLGALPTAYECALAAENYSECGETIMFSKPYPEWGCRCCVANDKMDLSGNKNWDVYSPLSCADVKTSRDVCNPIIRSAQCTTHEINFGTLTTPHECAQATAENFKCGDTFMFSKSYPEWGCRCCTTDDTIHNSGNDNWELYSASACGVKQARDVLERKIIYLEEENRALKEVATYKSTSEAVVSEAYGVLREVVETLRKEGAKLNIPWFAIGGTLIGALRSNPPGMARWDDDIDLAVKASGLEDLHNVLKSNPRLQWQRHGQFLAYKYGLANATFGYRLDLFGIHKVDSKWHYMDSSGESIESNFAFDSLRDEEIQSTYPCQFWDLTIECPVGGLSYIQRSYGERVMSEARLWGHGEGGGYRNIDMVAEDLNEHAAYFPAMTRELMSKLQFAVVPGVVQGAIPRPGFEAASGAGVVPGVAPGVVPGVAAPLA